MLFAFSIMNGQNTFKYRIDANGGINITGLAKIGTDTISTKAYARSVGGTGTGTIDTTFIYRAIGLKADTVNQTFTGTITLPSTTSAGDVSSTELQYVNGVTSAIQTQLNTKADTVGQSFTGTITLPSTTSIGDVSSTEIGYVNSVTSAIQTQLNSKLDTTNVDPIANYVPLLVDTIPLFVFGGGGGNDGDTTAITTNTLYGAFFNAGSDTLVVTQLRVAMEAGTTPLGTDTVSVHISWDINLKDGSPTLLNTNPLGCNSITGGTVDASFAASKIPPSVWVWATTPGVVVGRKPSMVVMQISGYKIPTY